MPHLAYHGARAYAKGRRGGSHETVEEFVVEAYEANIVLKLYEAATAKTVDVPSIARFMSKSTDSALYPPSAKTEWKTYAGDVDSVRFWALGVVEDAVNRKVENDVYPILLRDGGSYKEGWGFKSLLGGLWLQMRNFMLGSGDVCVGCGQIFPKTRRDRMYCDDLCSGRTRGKKAYAQKKKHREKKREETRRRLQG